jgi:hypothetical protein
MFCRSVLLSLCSEIIKQRLTAEKNILDCLDRLHEQLKTDDENRWSSVSTDFFTIQRI